MINAGISDIFFNMDHSNAVEKGGLYDKGVVSENAKLFIDSLEIAGYDVTFTPEALVNNFFDRM